MGNPIFNQNGSSNQPTNGLLGMIEQIRSSPNPEAAMQTLAQSNPQMRGVMDYIQQNGGDAKAAFYNMAAQKGVDPNSILKLLR